MASARNTPPISLRKSGDDMVLPFHVEKTGVRGRILRVGSVIDEILGQHDYPEPVSVALGEALVIAALLGSALKFDGSLTLQTHSDGPVSMIVASFAAPGKIRGYAMLDRERWEAMEKAGQTMTPADVVGSGHFALTIDPGAGMHRYQGIVEMSGQGMGGCAHDYFVQSEQIATRLKLAVGRRYAPGARAEGPVWRAGGILIQHLAAEGGLTDEDEREARIAAREEEHGPALTAAGERVEDAWTRVAVLLDTTEDHELLDPLLKPERLLMRLFHEDGVRVFDPLPLSLDCRCTFERLQDVLLQYAGDDLSDLIEDGKITMRCEFCNKDFQFDPDEITVAGNQA